MTGRGKRRVQLSAVHLLRVGAGSEAVRLQARGWGLLLGSFGLQWVRGRLDTIVLQRLPASGRCFTFFLGLHGLAWRLVQLPPAHPVAVPPAPALRASPLPLLRSLPSLEVRLTVRPPQLP